MKSIYIAALCALISAGCGSKDTQVITAPDGATVTSNSKDGSVTYDKGDVKASMGGGTSITEEQLTMPFYPGSTEKANSSMKVEAATEKNYMCVRLTADEPQKVADFHTSKDKDLKFTRFEANGDVNMMASATKPDGANVAITISRKSGASETEITMAYGLVKKG
jgi:hypothetical protein